MPRNPIDVSTRGDARRARTIGELEDQKYPIKVRVGSGPAGADGQSFRGHEALSITAEEGKAPGETINRLTAAGTAVLKKLLAGDEDQVVTLHKTGAGTLTVKKENNLKISAEFVLSEHDTLTLICDGTNWVEIARSNN